MSKNFLPIDGSEIQVQGFQFPFHAGDTLEEVQRHIVDNLKTVFKNETAHKIVRVTYQRGGKVFMFNAGFEDQMYNEVAEWIEEVSKREYYPMVFEFRNFVSYNPPSIA